MPSVNFVPSRSDSQVMEWSCRRVDDGACIVYSAARSLRQPVDHCPMAHIVKYFAELTRFICYFCERTICSEADAGDGGVPASHISPLMVDIMPPAFSHFRQYKTGHAQACEVKSIATIGSSSC